MKTLIVYFSKFGNTRKVAQTIAETMRQAGETHVVSIEQLAASDLEEVDLVVLGSPTHGFTVPEAVRSALAALPAGILAGKVDEGALFAALGNCEFDAMADAFGEEVGEGLAVREVDRHENGARNVALIDVELLEKSGEDDAGVESWSV